VTQHAKATQSNEPIQLSNRDEDDDEEHGEFRRKQRLKPRLFNHGVATLDIL